MPEIYYIQEESGDQMSGATPYIHGPYPSYQAAIEALKALRDNDKYNDFFLLAQEVRRVPYNA